MCVQMIGFVVGSYLLKLFLVGVIEMLSKVLPLALLFHLGVYCLVFWITCSAYR